MKCVLICDTSLQNQFNGETSLNFYNFIHFCDHSFIKLLLLLLLTNKINEVMEN